MIPTLLNMTMKHLLPQIYDQDRDFVENVLVGDINSRLRLRDLLIRRPRTVQALSDNDLVEIIYHSDSECPMSLVRTVKAGSLPWRIKYTFREIFSQYGYPEAKTKGLLVSFDGRLSLDIDLHFTSIDAYEAIFSAWDVVLQEAAESAPELTGELVDATPRKYDLDDELEWDGFLYKHEDVTPTENFSEDLYSYFGEVVEGERVDIRQEFVRKPAMRIVVYGIELD